MSNGDQITNPTLQSFNRNVDSIELPDLDEWQKDIFRRSVKADIQKQYFGEKKKEFEDIPWYQQAVGAVERGTRSTAKMISSAGESVSAQYIVAPYGFSMGDDKLKTTDPNYKEHLKALDFINDYKENVNPFITKDEIEPILKQEGFVNSEWGANGLYTQKSKAEQVELITNNGINTALDEFGDWVMKNPITVEDWSQIDDNILNTFIGAIPNVASIIGISYLNPYAGMTMAGSMMAGESWDVAEPYIEDGTISYGEASNIATVVGLTSLGLNYIPSMFYAGKNPFLKKSFEKSLFNKLIKKKAYQPIPKEMFIGSLIEGTTEAFDEIALMTGESQYRDVSWDEGLKRTAMAFSVGGLMGGFTTGGFTHFNNKQISKVFNDVENMVLPAYMEVNEDGEITFNVKEDQFDTKEEYEYVKKIVEDPKLIKRLNPSELIKKHPDVPIGLVVFHELITQNPNLADVKINFNTPQMTTIWTEEELINKGEDPNSPEWVKAQMRKGEYGYEENQKKYKVHQGGNNIYDETGGVINLTEGATQDVYVEEIAEIIYKKLATTNPELRQKIDNWIADITTVLDEEGVGGPRGIELFSKFYTFNYMGYESDVYDLGGIVSIPKEILTEFDPLMGEQSDGSNLSFIYKGKNPSIVEQVDEPIIQPQPDNPPIQETPKKSYRLEPTKLKTLYHTTLSKNLDGILKNGLRPLQTTLWTTPDGERHGDGEIYVFESLEDAKAWKIKMQFDLVETIGGFDLGEDATILEIDNKTDMWEEDIDVASGIPKNILGPDSGRWFRRFDTVPSEDIKVFDEGESFRLTPTIVENLEDGGDMTKSELIEAGFDEASTGYGEYAEIFNYEGKPVIAFHTTEDGYDGFAVHPDFQGQGIATAFFKNELKTSPFPVRVQSPNSEIMKAMESAGRVELTDVDEEIYTIFPTTEESFRLTPQQEIFFKDSKVRGEDGELIKVFHGTRNDFEEFKFLDVKTTNEHYAGDLGFWFTSEPKYKSSEYDEGSAEFMASEFAGGTASGISAPTVQGANVIPAYLNLKNPIEIYGDDLMHISLKQQLIDVIRLKYGKDVKTPKEIRETLLSKGVDGVHIIESWTDGNVIRDDWVSFKPEQIKSQFNVEPTDDPRMSYRNVPADVSSNILNSFSDESQGLSMLNILNSEDQETFANNNAIGTFLNDNSKRIQEEYGIDLTYNPKTGYNEDQINVISDVITREALNEILNNENNAGAWYSTNMENSIRLLGDIYPEILDNMDSRSTFVLLLAITSNGQAPSSNLKYAMEVYDFYKENGRFPETEEEFNSAGSVSPSMRQGFVKFNALVEEYGLDATISFLNTNFSVSELKDLGYTISGENVGQEIPGSIIFGPKIGGAFYPNLQGSYDFVTMDRWFMRTIGRITGELTKTDYSSQLKRFRKAMLGSKAQLSNYNVDVELFKTDDEYAISIASLVKNVYAQGSFQKKTELNMSSNNLMKQFDLVDSPRGGNQRASLRTIMSIATDNINQYILDNNIEFPILHPADVQALIWFPEKRLYDKLRTSKSILKETSYEDETIAILKSRGYDDKRISDILNTTEGFSTEGGSFNVEGESDQSEGIRKSYRLKPADKTNLEITPETISEQAIRIVQDQLYRLKVIQRKIGDVPENEDAYMEAELFIGRASDEVDNFRKKTSEPLIKDLTDAGFTIEDLGWYLYARHAKSRNAVILDRTDGKVKNGSGMTNKQANEILKKFEGTGINKFSKDVNKIIKQRLKLLYDGGLITKEDYDFFLKGGLWKNYVPLKGLANDEGRLVTGTGFSITGKDIKRAGGRESTANNPLVQVLADMEEAIIRVEKNKVGVAFYNLVQSNPSDIWKARGLKYIPRYNEFGDIEYFDPKSLKDNELEVKIDGKRKVIEINDINLLKGMKDLGSGKSIKALVYFNNFFRAVNTTLNPEFLITNFSRDVQTGAFNLGADYENKIVGYVLRDIFKAQKGIFDNIKGKDSEWGQLYGEFKKNGGKVGWFDQMTVEEKIDNLEKLIKKSQSKNLVGNSIRYAGDLIYSLNEIVESGVRLSTYKNLIDAGMSPKKSAQYAKNLTVNFNKKGEIGQVLNTLWVFSNAGIQGTARILQMGKSKKGKAIMGSLVAMGFLQSYLNRMVDDEDWEQFDDYNKDNYWMFMMPNGKSLSIKAPYGFNIFKVTGNLMEEMVFGNLSYADAQSRWIKAFGDSFNPLGASSTLGQFISPTISDPFMQINDNKNFFGGPIKPEQSPYGELVPESQLYFDSIRKHPKWLTDKLNKITGGSSVKSGYVDLSPEIFDHLIDSYTGGLGKFVANSVETGTNLYKGDEITLRNVPILRQFVKTKSEWKSTNIIYDMLKESSRTIYDKKAVDKFIQHWKFVKLSGKYEAKKIYKMKKDFLKNQRTLKREHRKEQELNK